MFCAKCGTEMSDNALACPKCGEPTRNVAPSATAKSRNLYCILAFFLGGLGIHNFYAGRWQVAVFEALMSCVVIPFLSGWIVAGTGDPSLLTLVQAFGYGFIVLLVIIEMITVKKDGKGIPFAGCENSK